MNLENLTFEQIVAWSGDSLLISYSFSDGLLRFMGEIRTGLSLGYGLKAAEGWCVVRVAGARTLLAFATRRLAEIRWSVID